MSSSFKENFSKKDEGEGLDYDDSAFYYFSVAILTFSLIPATYQLILKPMLYGDMVIKTSSIKNC
jgi:hypothetical protein